MKPVYKCSKILQISAKLMQGTGNGLKYETSVCTMKLQVWKYEVKIFQITK